jgi:uncharacterized membrane protein
MEMYGILNSISRGLFTRVENMSTQGNPAISNSAMSIITGLAGLMLLLLLSVPFLVQIDTQIDTIAYVVYAIFLISLSITIGMGIMWIMVSSRGEEENPEDEAQSELETKSSRQSKLHTEDENELIRLLEEHEGELWQSKITAQLNWSASKTSRVLSKLESSGDILRIRDGMGKRIKLTEWSGRDE